MSISTSPAATAPVALVTGATRGIGRAIGRELARRGNKVLVHGRTRESANQAADELRLEGFDVQAVYGDLSKEKDVNRLVTMASARCECLHVLVNNAGQLAKQPLRRASRDHWQQMLDSHLLGPLQLTSGLFPLLRKSNGGSIVNVSSIAAERPVVGRAAYSAAKAALVNLTLSLAKEWAPYNIRANAVLPGSIDTELLQSELPTAAALEHLQRDIGLKRLGRAEEVAQVVCFLASDQSAYCTGGSFPVHGGLR